MKKAKVLHQSSMTQEPSVLEGNPAQNPREDYVKKDAMFKKRRGAQS